MPSYYAVVELDSPSDIASSGELTTRMSIIDFKTVIEGIGGEFFRLPRNTYFADLPEKEVDRVRDLVLREAEAVNKSALVLVIEGDSSWTLLPIRKA